MDVQTYMHGVGREARKAARLVANADTATKNRALTAMAGAIRRTADSLIAANTRDVVEARDKGLDEAAVDRLTLTRKNIDAMADGLLQVASLPDRKSDV